MNDPHVESITYTLQSDDVYLKPPRLEFDSELFAGALDQGALELWPKDHYPSVEAVRPTADRFVRGWEVASALRYARGAVAFEYDSCQIIDRNPPGPGEVHLQAETGAFVFMGAQAGATVTRGAYPAPPDDFRFTEDVEALWGRLEEYRQGREKLLPMAYFCLTWIDRMGGGGRKTRKHAAKNLRIAYKVLDTLGRLTSDERGDPRSGRKVKHGRDPTPLSAQEELWIVAALEKAILNVGMIGVTTPRQVTMADLPKL